VTPLTLEWVYDLEAFMIAEQEEAPDPPPGDPDAGEI
jgi:hypothetical protein